MSSCGRLRTTRGRGIEANLVPGPRSVNSGLMMKSYENTIRELFKKDGKGGKESQHEVPVVMWINAKVTDQYPGVVVEHEGKEHTFAFAKNLSLMAGFYYPKGKDKWERDPLPKAMQESISIPRPDLLEKETVPNLNYIGHGELFNIIKNEKDVSVIEKERDLNGLYKGFASVRKRLRNELSSNTFDILKNEEIIKIQIHEGDIF